MRITRFVETQEGGSRFEEVEVAFPAERRDAFGNTYHASGPLAAPEAVLVELPAGLDQDWHNAPQRQLVFVLEGHIEVETTDRETRSWKRGGLFAAEDVAGRGHLTRVLEGPARLLFLGLPEDFAVADWSRAAGD